MNQMVNEIMITIPVVARLWLFVPQYIKLFKGPFRGILHKLHKLV